MTSRRSLFSHRFSAVSAPLAAISLALVLAGCGSTKPKPTSYDPEAFNSTDTHTRAFDATEAQVCEGARRALLSQGYLVTAANADLVTGRKSFQPAPEVHVELEFRVVCASESQGRKRASATPQRTLVFVSALQDRYSLKKVNNSASVGVGVLGSVSLPYSSSDDSLVKVASQTVTDERFYERFFTILERYTILDVAEPEPAMTMPVKPIAVSTAQALAPLPPLPPEPAPTESVAQPPASAPAPAPAPAVSASAMQVPATSGSAPGSGQQVQMRAPPVPVEPLGVPASMPGKPAEEASAADAGAKAVRN